MPRLVRIACRASILDQRSDPDLASTLERKTASQIVNHNDAPSHHSLKRPKEVANEIIPIRNLHRNIAMRDRAGAGHDAATQRFAATVSANPGTIGRAGSKAVAVRSRADSAACAAAFRHGATGSAEPTGAVGDGGCKAVQFSAAAGT